MGKKLQGIALILFGIMLLLISTLAPWIRVIGLNYSDVGPWISIILGVTGLVFVFKEDKLVGMMEEQ